jgi:hypothetical protein
MGIVVNKVSFYGYLFNKPAHQIIRYDILWGKTDHKYLLKHTLLDRNYKNPSDEITVMVYNSLIDCLSGVIGRFRNIEIENGVYKRLKPATELHESYAPLIDELSEAINRKQIKSFSIFRHLCKYKPQTTAKQLLRSMGIFILTTKRPHLYVLHDFIMTEYKRLPKNFPSHHCN